MNRHARELVLSIHIATGVSSMNVAHALEPTEKAITALEERVTRLESVLDRMLYAAVADPCLVSINGDGFSIVCSVSPPFTNPQLALRCLEGFGISMEFQRAPDGSGHLFVLKDAHNWQTTHLVGSVNDIRFCMIYGKGGGNSLIEME